MSLQDLVTAALAERLQAYYQYARADALLAAVIGEAERQRAAGIPARELSSDQRIGAIRLDGSDLPARPLITDTDQLGSWLAEHHPSLVTASIRVPVNRLEDALEALGYAGMGNDTEATITPRDEALAWLNDECIVQADPQLARAWNVLHRDDEGHLTQVPGTTARPPFPTWKVLVDKEQKAAAQADAQLEVEALVAALRSGYGFSAHSGDEDFPEEVVAAAELQEAEEEAERRGPVVWVGDGLRAVEDVHLPEPDHDVAALVQPVGPPVLLGPPTVTASMPRTLLVQRARELGLAVSGSKADLLDRINSHRP